MTDRIDAVIRAFGDAVAIHNYDQAEHWAEVAFELADVDGLAGSHEPGRSRGVAE